MDGKPVETDRHKAIGLLAYLAVEEKSQNRQSVAAMFWPDYPRTSAYSYLRRTVWELNQMLGKGWVESDRENIALIRQPGLKLDVEEFTRLTNPLHDEVDALVRAVELYRGDFLEGLVVADTAPFEEWQSLHAENFCRELAHALEKLVKNLEGSGACERALTYAQRWLSLDRLNEMAWQAIMRQLWGTGDRAGAIRAYQACAQTLKDELGVAPQPETDLLYQTILQGEAAQPRSTYLQKAVSELTKVQTSNLPIPATPFIGRIEEIAQIKQLALDQQARLLTLIGPGGTGKTRLAIQVATEIVTSYPDGAWFIPLAAVQSSKGIVPVIAQGLNFSFYKGEVPPHQQLMDYLRKKDLLLVLDNFEHLVTDGRQLVTDILAEARQVKLLVTSRERLNLQVEQIYRVRGLSTPEGADLYQSDHPEEKALAYSSIQLLVERARRVKPEFKITKSNLKPVLEICQLVDGSPLGIELAAAWLEVLPEEEIAQEIVRSLDFLESTAADTPERQRSLRMVFDTSWRLLNLEEQQAFRRLCAFRGSFSREAAQVVSGAGLRTLLSLANKSWLQQNDSGRYQLHEVLKQYGMERLKADPVEWRVTKDQQAEYFCKFMEVQGKALHTSEQIQALQTIKPELESNIPDAWEWLVANVRFDDLIVRMLPGMAYYWLVRGPSIEIIPLLKKARNAIPNSPKPKVVLQNAILETVELNLEVNLFVFDDNPRERLEQLWDKANKLHLQDEMGFWWIVLVSTYGNVINFQEGLLHLAEILQKVDNLSDEWEIANLYLLAGWFAVSSEAHKHKEYLLKALEIFKKLGVVQEQGNTLRALAGLASIHMDYEQAIRYTVEAQTFYEQVGDLYGMDSTWTSLAEYYIYLGKIEQAMHAFHELRHHTERTGNRRFLGTDMSWESLHVSRFGSLQTALELREQSLAIAHEVGNQHDSAWAAWELGEIYRLMGKQEAALKYFQESLPYFQKMEDYIGLGFYHRGLGDLAMMQGNFEEARKKYQEALKFHEKEQRGNREWGLALTHARLGTILVVLGKLEAAKSHLKTSLEEATNWINPDLKALPLLGIAHWLVASGFTEKAIELAACVACKPTTWNEIKQQAHALLLEMNGKITQKEAAKWEKRGEEMTIDEACKRYGGKEGF
jgi:predicted ATPase/DNA-binding SARP family transcriptional activator/tetratricopeptide (TPR) repeat protein